MGFAICDRLNVSAGAVESDIGVIRGFFLLACCFFSCGFFERFDEGEELWGFPSLETVSRGGYEKANGIPTIDEPRIASLESLVTTIGRDEGLDLLISGRDGSEYLYGWTEIRNRKTV